MRGIVAVVCALAGCDRVLGLHAPATADGPPQTSCMALSPAPYLCADFDEAQPVVYEKGAVVAFSTAASGATVAERAPAVSMPNALWIDGQGGIFTIQDATTTSTVIKIHTTFALQITQDPSSTSSAAFVGLGLISNAFNNCIASLLVDPTPAISFDGHCSTATPHVRVLDGLPLGWTTVVFDLDLANGTSVVTIGSGSPVSIPLGFSSAVGGTPDVTFGLSPASAGIELGLDDIIVTLSP